MCIRDRLRTSADHTPYCAYHASYHLATCVDYTTCTCPDARLLVFGRGGSEEDESTSDRGGGGVADEPDDGLAHLNNLDVTWGFDLDAFCRSAHTRHLLPAMMAKGQPRRWIRLNGERWTPPPPRQGGPKQSRRWVRLKGAWWPPPRSQQGGPKAARAHLQPPAPTKGTAKIPPWSCRGGQHTNSAAGDGSPREYGARPGVRINAWRDNLLRSSIG